MSGGLPDIVVNFIDRSSPDEKSATSTLLQSSAVQMSK
jgi:hypothetical protein